jgi:hypothetical protein
VVKCSGLGNLISSLMAITPRLAAFRHSRQLPPRDAVELEYLGLKFTIVDHERLDGLKAQAGEQLHCLGMQFGLTQRFAWLLSILSGPARPA